MRVALLNTKATLRAVYLLECFAEGIKKAGDEPIWFDNSKALARELKGIDCGLQVCFPNRHKARHNTKQANFRLDSNTQFAAAKKRIITIDTGFIRNQSDYELDAGAANRRHQVLFDIDNKDTYEQVLLEIYYEIGFDGLKRHADYCNDNVTGDRWQKLGGNALLAPWREKGDHILVMGQTLFGLSSQHVNIYDWYAQVVREIRKHSNRTIVLRQHPRLTKIREGGSRTEKDRKQILRALGRVKNFEWSQGWTTEEDLKGAWASVVFSSNAAVSSVRHGIPVFVGDRSCMAWEVGNHSLAEIENPAMPDRTLWAHRLAYAQWTCQEMIDGEPWSHLRPHATKPPKNKMPK